MKRITKSEVFYAMYIRKNVYALILENEFKIIEIKSGHEIFISPKIRNINNVIPLSENLLFCVNTTGKSRLLDMSTGKTIKSINLGPELYNQHFAVFPDRLWYLNKDWRICSLNLKSYARKLINPEECFGFYDCGNEVYFVFYDKFARNAVESKMRITRFSKERDTFDDWVIHLPEGCVDSFLKIDENRAVMVMNHTYKMGAKDAIYIVDLSKRYFKKIVGEKDTNAIFVKVAVYLSKEIIFYAAENENKMIVFDMGSSKAVAKYFFNAKINDIKINSDTDLIICTDAGAYVFELESFLKNEETYWKYIEL